MTLPNSNQKLGKNEIESITNAVKDAGIQQIHPNKMEAYAEYLVEKMSSQNKKDKYYHKNTEINMESIEKHIEKDKEILQDPTLSPQMRRHTADELEHLERYHKEHPEDHHDPSSFEMFCDENPDADECRIYED
tara:strand:- start:210 stop:611 length:402 start_codon:yes stop_codon:yes gene_type:complete